MRELSAATDALNDAISEAESALAEQELGVAARVEAGETRDNEGVLLATNYLAFDKRGNAWRLLWVSVEPDGAVTERHLTAAPRAARVEGAAKLAELHTKLVEDSLRQLEAVRRATASYDSFARGLRPRLPKDDDIPF